MAFSSVSLILRADPVFSIVNILNLFQSSSSTIIDVLIFILLLTVLYIYKHTVSGKRVMFISNTVIPYNGVK